MFDRTRVRLSVWLGILIITLTIGCGIFIATEANASGDQSSANVTRQETAWQIRLRELDARLNDPRWLLLKYAEFDPGAGEPATVKIGAQELQATSIRARPGMQTGQEKQAQAADDKSRAYFIIQFNQAIRPEDRDALLAGGYDIVGYVPNNAYLVRAAAARQNSLNNLPAARDAGQFRWVGAYGPALKIEPSLARMANEIANGTRVQATAGEEFIAVSFVTFSGEKPDAARAALAGLSLETRPILEERADSRVWGVVMTPSSGLPQLVTALAEVEGIEWIEQRRSKQLHNDSGVRIIQSGTSGGDTSLFRNGLTGAGQVFGEADAGLDTDHAQFRLDGSAAAQTLSVATSTQELSNGLLPFNITDPNNKVLAYFLLGAGAFITNSSNRHGERTLNATERSGASYINSVAYDDSNGWHGTHTASVAAGRSYLQEGTGALPGIAGRMAGDGMAPDARIVFQDIGHPDGDLPGANFVSQALIHQQAYGSGARIHNNSYGASPPATYDQDALDIDGIMWRLRDYTIFYSAGNDGPGANTLSTIAKNNVLVGASDSPTAAGGDNSGNIEAVSDFSAHGPTRDGRIKPDIIAPGWVRAATESAGIVSQFDYQTSRTALDAAVNPTNPNNNNGLSVLSGTSFSSPMAAGGALLVRQYFTDGYYPGGASSSGPGFNPSNALVKAIILNSGRNMTGAYTADNAPNGEKASLPNSGQGWGRMALDDALYFPGDRRELKVIADIFNGATAADGSRPATNAAITTGQVHEYIVSSVSTVEPLRITLAWSDPKAALSASAALVNNLDLEIIAPNGATYRGNVNFASAWSQPTGSAGFDNKNNVEAVYIQFPQAGDYRVRVIGANVPGNGESGVVAMPNNQTIDSNRQGYALVATGNFTAGAVPVLTVASTEVSGGVNADQFISRNETVAATITVNAPTNVAANGVGVQLSVNAGSEVPASVVSINGGPTGQPATISYGDLAAFASASRSFQITLRDDGVNRAGKKILFDVTITPTNGVAFTSQFTITAQRRLYVYRTRWEPASSGGDPGGTNVIVIPESAWGLRPGAPNAAPSGNAFAGNWQLTTAVKASGTGSTACLGDPSGVGSSYGVSATQRGSGSTGGAGIYDQTRWWTLNKILLPGLTRNAATDRVSNAALAAQLNASVESLEVDINLDFNGDAAQGGITDIAYVRLRPYTNVSLSAADDTGFNENTFTNMIVLDSIATPTTSGFKHFSLRPDEFIAGNGIFGINTTAPDSSDVAFRLELQFTRNGVTQTGEGVFFDNLELRLAVDDTASYSALTQNKSTSVNAASFGSAAAPGAILAAFGSGIPVSSNIGVAAQGTPLPRELSAISVRVNGVTAPLFFAGVSGGSGAFQINYQLPYETAPGVALVEVLYNGNPVTSEFLSVAAAAPGVFTANASGKGQAVAQNQDFSFNGDQSASAKPAARGSVLILYANGQGGHFVEFSTGQPLTTPASGDIAPFDGRLFVTREKPVVTIGGVPAGVEFSGLTPGLVGLWQLNLRIPDNAPVGNAVPLIINLGGGTSATTTIAVN